jgi:hypothetical protein
VFRQRGDFKIISSLCTRMHYLQQLIRFYLVQNLLFAVGPADNQSVNEFSFS